MSRRFFRAVLVGLLMAVGSVAGAQEKSVRPGVNDTFKDPDLKQFQERFETESREIFAKRKEILEACKVTHGMSVADVGAGTGLFTRAFAEAVGTKGSVIAVDISKTFLDHIATTSREEGMTQVVTLEASTESSNLPADSVDLVFICDTYHHFEFPIKTMQSIHRALRSGGRVVMIDFKRIEGESTDWVMSHVRAGQEVFESEVEQSGFRKVGQVDGILKENYLLIFEKK